MVFILPPLKLILPPQGERSENISSSSLATSQTISAQSLATGALTKIKLLLIVLPCLDEAEGTVISLDVPVSW